MNTKEVVAKTVENSSEYLGKALDMALSYGPKFIFALILLIVGLSLIKISKHLIAKGLEKRKVDETVKPFLVRSFSILLKIVLFIAVAQTMGFQTTSFVAILGAAGLAVGFALKDTLSNFASGILMILLGHIKVGDFIETQGVKGKIKEIKVFKTILTTPDNRQVILPNGPLFSNMIINYTAEETRRIELTFGIGYGDDIQKAQDIIRQLIEQDSRILKAPAPHIGVSELADSSVNIAVWVWCKKEDYLGIKTDLLEKVKVTFDQKGISIPFPQTDFHLIQAAK